MPSEEDFQDLWDNCYFVFDANVLLNIYRFSPETRNEFLEILNNIKSRIWIPYQAAYEYHNNRLTVIRQQEKAYDELMNSLSGYSDDIFEILKKIRSHLKSYKKHPFIDGDKYSKKFETISVIVELDEIIDDLKINMKNHPSYTFNQDELMEKLTILLDGKVGPKCSSNELEEIYRKGKIRYSKEIPPGFGDKKKDKKDKSNLKKYGDLIIWFQIIKKAEELKKPIIFVTDDKTKDDWFLRINNHTYGPRPELIEEIKEKADVNFYLYSANRFMKFYGNYFDYKVPQNAIDEVKNLDIYNFSNQMPIKDFSEINIFQNDYSDLLQRAESIEEELISMRENSINFDRLNELKVEIDELHREVSDILKLVFIKTRDLKNELKNQQSKLNIIKNLKDDKDQYFSFEEILRFKDEMSERKEIIATLENKLSMQNKKNDYLNLVHNQMQININLIDELTDSYLNKIDNNLL